jgi:DMSO reductase anchor subunit
VPRNALPADYYQVRPSAGHLALVVMLVGTQLAVGALALGGLVRFAAGCAALAMLASLAHLGRPHLAHRALRGLGHSWLSREILAFGGFAALAAAAVVVPALELPAAIAGGVAVFTSMMVYADTGRPLWRADLVAMRFFGTAGLLGAACAQAWPAVLAIAGGKLLLELVLLARVRDRHHGPFRRSATLLLGPLRRFTAARLALLVIGALALPLLPPAAIALLFAGELIERHLFFVASAAPRMPGGLA